MFCLKNVTSKTKLFYNFFVLTLITLHALLLHSSYCPDDAFESSHGAYVLDVHTFKFQAFLPPLHRQQSTQTDRQTSALLALLSVCHYNDSLLKPHSFKITFDNTNIVYIHFNFETARGCWFPRKCSFKITLSSQKFNIISNIFLKRKLNNWSTFIHWLATRNYLKKKLQQIETKEYKQLNRT